MSSGGDLVAAERLRRRCSAAPDEVLPWSALVLPIAVGIFAASILLLKRAD